MEKLLNITTYKILVSLLFGLTGFIVNFHTFSFPFPPYTATVLIGLLFPMLIALSWGWKYGLLSALVGGCQSMWWLWGASNGYAISSIVLPFTLWIVWHGICANLRRKNDKWYLNKYFTEIPFRILSTLNLYTLSRYLITLNPPSWAPESSNVVPICFSNFVVIKQTIVAIIILMIADVFLGLPWIQKFFKLERSKINRGQIISFSLLLGFFFWFLSGLFDWLIFKTSTLLESTLLLDVLCERILFVLFCLILGLILAYSFKQRQDNNKKYFNLMNKYEDNLDKLRELTAKLQETKGE